jgi:hypothetical protein
MLRQTEMAYRVRYEHPVVLRSAGGCDSDATVIEYFVTEREAMRRARQLRKVADCRDVAVSEVSGGVTAGVRLDGCQGTEPTPMVEQCGKTGNL